MALLGIGAGGLLYGVAAGDRPASLRLFALTCAIEAVVIIVPFAMGDGIAILASLLRQLSLFGFAGQVAGWAVICAIVVLPAGIVSGFQFPLLIALLGRGRTGVGTDAGYAYAWNTLGAIGGSIAGGFGLLPLLTAPGAWRAAAATMVVLSGVTIIVSFSRKERLAFTAAALAIAATLLMIVPHGPTAVWRHSPIGAGRSSFAGFSRMDLEKNIRLQRRTTVWEAEGIESSVAMSNANGLNFIVNGKVDGHATGDAATQVMSGLLGAIMHPQPKTSLVIGLGTGSTAGWLSLIPTMEKVDVAELEPVIRHVAEVCRPVNAAALERPNVNLIYGDAREILLTGKDRYDIIFSEPSNPYRAGIASLFTQEFYAAAADRLESRGIFLQWVQAYDITGPTLATIYRTLTSVFPHVQTWQTRPGDLLLIGSMEEQAIDGAAIRTRIEQEPYRSALRATWLVHDLEGLLAHHVASSGFPRALLAGTWGDINTDDRNQIEFGFARSVGTTGIDINQILRLASDGGFHPPVISGSGPLDWTRVQAHRNASLIVGTATQAAPSVIHDDAGAEDAFFSISSSIRSGLHAAAAGDEAASNYAERLESFAPRDAGVIRASLFATTRRHEDAERELSSVLLNLRSVPWITNEAMQIALGVVVQLAGTSPEAAARLRELVSEPFSVSLAEEQRRQLLLQIAPMIDRSPCGPMMMEALVSLEPHVPWNEQVLTERARCYESRSHRLRHVARRDRERYLSQMPTRLSIGEPVETK
jgi:spermidine synthase